MTDINSTIIKAYLSVVQAQSGKSRNFLHGMQTLVVLIGDVETALKYWAIMEQAKWVTFITADGQPVIFGELEEKGITPDQLTYHVTDRFDIENWEEKLAADANAEYEKLKADSATPA